MAKVKITGHASGSGVLTITAPNTSTDRTITLPDATGTLLNSDGSAANLTAIPAAQVTGTLPAISGASLTGIGGRRNLVKNGGFDVWQRGTSFSNVSGKNYIADRWWCTPNSGAHTQTRQASGLDGFDYCLRMQRTAGQSAGGVVYLLNEFESIDSSRHRGKKLTFSFYARKGANFSHASSQITSNLISGTGTNQSLSAGLTGGANLISLTNTLTTSWQRFTHTTSSVVASNVNQICIQFTTAHAGTAGANDYYELAGVQLEVGTEATDFEHRSYGEELALCQRYYFIKGQVARTCYGVAACHTATSIFTCVAFPVTMRASPSMSQYSDPTTCYITGSGQNQATQNTNMGTEGLNPNGCTVTATGSSLSGGNAYWFNTVDAQHWLAWEAEI